MFGMSSATALGIVLILLGAIFLIIAIIGKTQGTWVVKVEDRVRKISAALGVVLLLVGVVFAGRDSLYARASGNLPSTPISIAPSAPPNTGSSGITPASTLTSVSTMTPTSTCRYTYWKTGSNMDVSLSSFGVPEGCVLVLDSFQGSLISSNGAEWDNGGVMAFPSGVYSGDIFNGEYEIVPAMDARQVFCNRVQQVTTNHFAFSHAKPLPQWGLTEQILLNQGRC